MKKLIGVSSVVLIVGFLGATLFLRAQEKPGDAGKYEYAILKWDGPDRLYYNLPDKFEMVHLDKQGKRPPKEAQDEEWCLALGCNIMARDGWEAVNLDSRRILMRRPLTK